jgi:predicted ester cyclase
MAHSAGELGRIWFEEVWNQGRREAIAEMLAPNILLHDGGVDTEGTEPFHVFFDRMQDTFSDIHVDVDFVLGEGDIATVRWNCKAKHTGLGFGIPPTGVEIHVTGISIIQVEDGLMTEAWQNWDMLGMMEQIKGHGASPTYVTA